MIARRKIISGSAEPIFAIFTPNDRSFFVDDRSGPFLIPQRMLLWQPIKVEKLAFLRTNLLCRAAIQKWIAISEFRFQKIR